MDGDARRISYQALRKGVPVRASDGEEIGTVEHVLQVPELDVFDGIVLTTADGLRFADADQVADITDRYVVLKLPAGEAERLGRPQARRERFYSVDSTERVRSAETRLPFRSYSCSALSRASAA